MIEKIIIIIKNLKGIIIEKSQTLLKVLIPMLKVSISGRNRYHLVVEVLVVVMKEVEVGIIKGMLVVRIGSIVVILKRGLDLGIHQ